MLDDDDDGGRQDDEDGIQLEGRRVDGREGKPRRGGDVREIDDADGTGDEIARDDADEDGDDGEKAAKCHGGKDRDGERCNGDKDDGRVDLLRRQTCHPRRRRHQLQSNDGDDCAH